MKLEPMRMKWKSFGWVTYEINGHDFNSLENVIRKFKKNPKPTVVICRTIKGKGISFMEDDILWHYRSPDETELKFIFNRVEIKIMRNAFVDEITPYLKKIKKLFYCLVILVINYTTNLKKNIQIDFIIVVLQKPI